MIRRMVVRRPAENENRDHRREKQRKEEVMKRTASVRVHPSVLPALDRHRARRLFGDESGAATAEYAIATMAAVAFAGLLVVIMRTRLTKC